MLGESRDPRASSTHHVEGAAMIESRQRCRRTDRRTRAVASRRGCRISPAPRPSFRTRHKWAVLRPSGRAPRQISRRETDHFEPPPIYATASGKAISAAGHGSECWVGRHAALLIVVLRGTDRRIARLIRQGSHRPRHTRRAKAIPSAPRYISAAARTSPPPRSGERRTKPARRPRSASRIADTLATRGARAASDHSVAKAHAFPQ